MRFGSALTPAFDSASFEWEKGAVDREEDAQ